MLRAQRQLFRPRGYPALFSSEYHFSRGKRIYQSKKALKKKNVRDYCVKFRILTSRNERTFVCCNFRLSNLGRCFNGFPWKHVCSNRNPSTVNEDAQKNRAIALILVSQKKGGTGIVCEQKTHRPFPLFAKNG